MARLVPIWMNTLPISAAAKASGRNSSSEIASAVPTSTGATAAGSVRGRDATSHSRMGLKAAWETCRSPAGASRGRRRGPPGPPRCRRRAGWRRGRAAGCPASPSSAALKLALSRRSENGESSSISRHHATVSRSSSSSGTTAFTRPMSSASCGVVLAAQEPDLLGLLGPHEVGEQAGAEAAVERADLGPGLAEAGVVGGDRQVADHVQHVAAADRVAGHHGHHGLRQAADLHVQVGHVEAADARPAPAGSPCRRARAGRRRSRRPAAPRR